MADKDPTGPDSATPTRDERGRWVKGHCPNPAGRPRKQRMGNYDPADLRHFGNTQISVRSNGEEKKITRREALLNKMFESAMSGKVSSQRHLMKEFEEHDRRLAMAQRRYLNLAAKWILDNDLLKDEGFASIPVTVRREMSSLQAMLEHYYPGQFIVDGIGRIPIENDV